MTGGRSFSDLKSFALMQHQTPASIDSIKH